MIVYQDNLDGITEQQLSGFFVGWQRPPSPATLLKLLSNSTHRILAIDDATGHVVGFITALSDGVLSASVPFLEVLPAYRGRGIGEALVRRMLDALGDLYMIDFVCHPDMQPFYTRLGLKPSTGMMRRNLKRQAGV